jgi:lipopolysaccharide transport system ATP-binding protein
MPVPIIEATQLSKRYRLGAISATSLKESFSGWRRRRREKEKGEDEREFWALREVSFSVQPGEVVGIIGRNGAGKSTLLKILSRITEPTSGRAILRGRVASLLEVGTGFHPDLTGRENVFLNGAILGMTKAEIRRKFDEIVAFAEVDQFIDTPVKHFSSGMYVRLAFAVAAHLEPEILIVDEVLAVGDASFQKKCLGKMKDVSDQEGRTVLFVSHNTDAVLQLCQSAMLLKAGSVIGYGPAGSIVSNYLAQGEGHGRYQAPPDKPEGIQEVVTLQAADHVGTLGFTVRFQCPQPLKLPTFGVVVSTLGGAPIFGSNSIFHPWARLPGPQSRGSATVSLQELPLWSGIYKASFWLSDGPDGVDMISDAVIFEVASPHLPLGAPSPKLIGPVHLPGDWTFQA